MGPYIVGYIGLIFLILLIFSGIPVGFAMALVGLVGMCYLIGSNAGLGLLTIVPYHTIASYSMSVVPLFVLMGLFCYHARINEDLYRALHKWLGHLPGGLAMVTVWACAGFAAVSGSSLATAATMGTMALPEMKKYKYDPKLATGCVAAGGTIGILIPPSIILIIYGILTEQSIGKLFIAGIIPGILEAVFYVVTIYILCRSDPLMGPRAATQVNLREKLRALGGVWPVLTLFLIVIGGIYLGVFSPTEAGGVGACGAFLLTLVRKRFTWRDFTSSLIDAADIVAMTFTILIGAYIFGYFLVATSIHCGVADFISGLHLNRYIILAFILLIYIALGCVMDSLAMIVLTIPIFYPLIIALNFDPVWFGIIMVRVVEIGLITPPIGINVYIIKGVAKDIPMETIFRGILPFLIADFCHLALLIAVPQVVLFLPGLMK